MRHFFSTLSTLGVSFALGCFGAYLYFVSFRGLLRWDLIIVSGAVFSAVWFLLGAIYRHFLDPDRNAYRR